MREEASYLDTMPAVYENGNDPQILRWCVKKSVGFDFLEEIALNLRKHFPERMPFLELATDPEGGETQLWAHAAVPPGISVEEAMEREDRFYDEWWLDNCRRHRLVHAHMEFVSDSRRAGDS